MKTKIQLLTPHGDTRFRRGAVVNPKFPALLGRHDESATVGEKMMPLPKGLKNVTALFQGLHKVRFPLLEKVSGHLLNSLTNK